MRNAERFVELLESGKFHKQKLENVGPCYSESQEKCNLENYRFFANSFALDEVMKYRVSNYRGDEQI